jgi:pimeloyl-ACP methyl ester carboxylesterase
MLAHGFMLDAQSFDAQLPALIPRYRTITSDARGHGRTSYDGLPFTEWDNVEDLIALMDHLGIAQAVVAGHSQGGYVALCAALRFPERVSGLILMGATAAGQDPDSSRQVEEFGELWGRIGPSDDLCEMFARMMFGASDASSWIAKWQKQSPADYANSFRAVQRRDDISDRLGEICVPALIIHGTDDMGISLDEARALAASIPNALPVKVIQGAPHASCCTHPDAVNALILDFLGEL